YTFNQNLKVDTTGRKILLTEPPMNPNKNCKKTCEVMLENYRFDGVYVAIQVVFTLYAQGLQTGEFVDSGDGVTHIVPVYNEFLLPHQTKRIDVAGSDVTSYLIKEKRCYVSYDLDLDKRLSKDTTVFVENYTLTNGRVIKI
ncbi:actin-domain-containing protein, partial [Phakopsora pachyrhizi]